MQTFHIFEQIFTYLVNKSDKNKGVTHNLGGREEEA